MKGERATGSNHKTSLTNGQVIPSSSSVKFLGITYSDLTFRSHFRTVATLARHRLLKLNSIFSSTYDHSTSILILHPSLFDYCAPATCIASPHIQLSWEMIQTQFISRALSIPSFIHNDRKRQHAGTGARCNTTAGYRTISTVTLKTSGGFQILGPWAIFYMRGPACERREQLGVWGRCLKIFRFCSNSGHFGAFWNNFGTYLTGCF